MTTEDLYSKIYTYERQIQGLEQRITSENEKIIKWEKEISSATTVRRRIMVPGGSSTPDAHKIPGYQLKISEIRKQINDFQRDIYAKQKSIGGLRKSIHEAEMRERSDRLQLLEEQKGSDSQNSNLNFETIEDNSPKTKNLMEEKLPKEQLNKKSPIVFISYSWDSEAHIDEVLSFAEYLRKEGFHSKLDKVYSQEETAINFTTMMHKAVNESQKVIIVLSHGYKVRADNFQGGVGIEYQLMINDMKTNPTKYILVSFKGRGNEIIPLGFVGADIVDISEEAERLRLHEKLRDHKRFILSEPADTQKELPIYDLKEFKATSISPALEVNRPFMKLAVRKLYKDKYRSLEFSLEFRFTNTGRKVIDRFAYHLHIPKSMLPREIESADIDGYIKKQLHFKEVFYPEQTFDTDPITVRISHRDIDEIIDSKLKVSVFLETGAIKAEFPITDLAMVPPPLVDKGQEVPLSSDLFTKVFPK